jgi:hypothetical protein
MFPYIPDFNNFSPQSHKFGIVIGMRVPQPEKIKLQQNPRVHFYKRERSGEFCITISDEPQVFGIYVNLVSDYELQILKDNVKKFKIPLLNFWYDYRACGSQLEEQMDDIRNGKEVIATYLTKERKVNVTKK